MACVMICAMLLPMISLPVEASGTRSGSTSPDLGSVNESLPFWVSTWRELSARLEAWSTPYRAVNVSYSNEVGGEKFRRNKGDDRKKREPIDDMDVASARPQPPGSSGNLLNAAKTSPTAASAKPATDPRRAVSSILNQLPPDEHDSVYTAQNNLGMPRGQTEIDSTNSPATLPIQHRVGSANFSFGLTLAYLSGRGINAGVGLTFNSRTWNKSCAHYGTNGCDLNHFTYDVERSWVAPGFSSGFGYLESVAYQTSAEYDLYKVYPLGLTDADGGRHQLTCAAWSGSACTGFRSSDGTFIRTSGDVPISGLSGYANAQFTVTYPNGTKMWYAGAFGSGTNRRHYPVVIQDNNGNRIRIEYKSDQSGRIDNVTDTLNRKIKFYYENDANGNPDKLVAVTIPGIDANEELQTVRFYYQTLALSSAGKFIGDITAPASIRVLQYIYLPATKTGFKYDYDTNYGVMRKITRLAGMTVDSTSTTSTGAVTGDGVTAATTEYNYPDGTTALADVPKYTQRSDDWAGKNGSGPEITLYD